MFGWFRRKKKQTPAQATQSASTPKVPPDEGSPRKVPEWAPFGTLAEYRRFLQLVRDHFASEGRAIVLNDGIVYGGVDAEPDGTSPQLGLQNLAQMCHQNAPNDWPEIIGEHFGAMREGQRFGKEWDARHADYNWAKQRLMLRLQPADYLDAFDGRAGGKPARPVYRVDLPQTITLLVADFPTTTMSIDHDTLEKWGVPVEQVFADAMQNVAQFAEIEWGELPADGDPPLTLRILSGEGYYATSHVLRLGEFPDCVGRHGTLLSVGNRGGAVLYPIESAEFIAAINAMVPIAMGTFNEGPGSISPHLYWCKSDGSFEVQRCTVKEGKLVFSPSKGFVALLERFARDGDAEADGGDER